MENTAFDVSQLDAPNTSDMVVHSLTGEPTNWRWTFAGPGHEATVKSAERLARERLMREKKQEQDRVNGRKWKAEDVSPQEMLEKNAQIVLDRLLGWSEVMNGGQPFEFSIAAARSLLIDPKKPALLRQALDFLGDETSFT